jgi:hypothetical protein
MFYGLIASLLGLAGSVSLALWFRHKASDMKRELGLARRSHAATLDELQAEHAAHIDARARLEALNRGKVVEIARLEKTLHDHLTTCPDREFAGNYIRSRLSVSTISVTPVSEYVPDPSSTQGGEREGGGSS